MPIHHPTGITVEIVGIEASTNGRSCDQHDVCGSVLDDDVVVRLRKVQILNSNGHEETAIAAYLVSDGIDQCRVGFLQRHFVAHAKSFDGVLAQVTEVYSITSDSPIKRKKCRHNMGCCLAAVISPMSMPATANVNRIVAQREVLEKEEEEEEEGQAIEVSENIAGNDDTNNSSGDHSNGEHHSTFQAPSAAAMPPAPAQNNSEEHCCTPVSEKRQNVTKKHSSKKKNDDSLTRNHEEYETPVSEKRSIRRKKTSNAAKRTLADNSDSQAPTSIPPAAAKKKTKNVA